MSGYLLNMYTMRRKAQNNAAEIIITIVAIAILLASCSTTSSSVMKHGVNPKYMQLHEHVVCQNCDEVD